MYCTIVHMLVLQIHSLRRSVDFGKSEWQPYFMQSKIKEIKEEPIYNSVLIISSEIQSKSAIACDICEKISTTAHIFLKTGASSKTVANYLEMACGTAMDDVEKDRVSPR